MWGGISGINRGRIERCTNYAEVVLTGIGDYGAGGIAGLSKCKVLEGEDEENPIIPVIQDCVNRGNITAPWKAGGICAHNDCAFIYDCGNESAVTVQYQKGYIYPEHPEWYEKALAAGICGDMGWNSIENCYNTGRISILEEGEEATYGIAGGTLFWINTVTGCVSLKGTAQGDMRHESVMELEKNEMEQWLKDHESISYTANNWKFNLEEAKKKLGLVPLGIVESPLSADIDHIFLCKEFCFRAPDGYVIYEASPYALCMEAGQEIKDGFSYEGQMWLLRLPEDSKDKEAAEMTPDENGMITKDTAHSIWLGISGSHWLHPGYGYKDDCHVENGYGMVGIRRTKGEPCIVHYRDDYLAWMAVGEDGGMIDNVAVIPLRRDGEGYESRWLLLFTNQTDNYRPSLSFVKEVLKGFHYLPCEITVKPGDSLFEIALQCTGEGALYWELADENELPDADYIVSGQALKVPERWLVRN